MVISSSLTIFATKIADSFGNSLKQQIVDAFGITRQKVFLPSSTCSAWVLHICTSTWRLVFNSLRPRQNGRHFPDDIFQCIFLNENVCISLKISLKFVPDVRINNIPALVQIMAWRRPGDKPLSEPIMVNLLTHICVTRPQWVKSGLILHKIAPLALRRYAI